MRRRTRSSLPLVAGLAASVATGAALAADVSDAEVLAMMRRHCVMCHAKAPAHPAFAELPKEVALETIEQLKAFAAKVFEQTVQNRGMAMCNQTRMSEEERAALGRWIAALK